MGALDRSTRPMHELLRVLFDPLARGCQCRRHLCRILAAAAFVLALLALTGCKSTPSCEAVWDHIVSLAPAELRAVFQARRALEIEACKQLSDAERKCGRREVARRSREVPPDHPAETC